jgi:VanZ family protein
MRFGFLIAALMWATFTALGSWYPFDFQTGTLDEAWDQWSRMPTRLSKSDLAINLMLGIPLGYFAYLAMRPNQVTNSPNQLVRNSLATSLVKTGWMIFLGMLTTGLVLLCALTVELGQHWFGKRVPSLMDTAAQTAGGVLGMLVACGSGQWLSQRLRILFTRRQGENAWQALLDLYLVGYAMWMLQPFIPAISPSELKAKWNSGMIQLGVLSQWETDVWGASYTALMASMSALPIGLWFALRSSVTKTAMGVFESTSLACLAVASLELAQIFIETRSAELADIVWSCTGVTIGIVIGFGFFSQRSSQSQGSPLYFLPIVALLYTIGYVAVAWAPFDWLDTKAAVLARWDQLRAGPITGLFSGNDMANASNFLRCFLMSVPLGAVFPLAALRVFGNFPRSAIGLSVVAVLAVCIGAELGQLLTKDRFPDLSAAILRLVGGTLGIVLGIRMRPAKFDDKTRPPTQFVACRDESRST